MSDGETENNEERGKQMSFLEHLDELRRRLVNSVIIVVVAFMACWFASGEIYDFLSVPIRRAISEAERVQVPVEGIHGTQAIVPGSSVKEGDEVRYVFDRSSKIGPSVIAPGASVAAIAARSQQGELGLYTNEEIFAGNAIIPKGVKLPAILIADPDALKGSEERLIVTTAVEPFTLYVTVSMYAAIVISVPFLLFQIWGFISPALYKHERAYVTPFILLSTISFVVGTAFAYYILFPPAVGYLLGLGEDFRLLLRASDYLDFITLIMLAMGIIFQMPAVTYVLSRIGIVSAGFLIRSWKLALIVILIVAAVVSPTADIPNMLLFAAPMMALYVVSIGIAWFFGRTRKTDAEMAA